MSRTDPPDTALPTPAYPGLVKTCGKVVSLAMNQAFQAAGYATTGAQWAILDHLRARDGVTQQELADRYDSNKVTAFRLLERLEEQGLVARRPDPTDGRCRRVHLTDAGRALHAVLAPVVARTAAWLCRDIPEADMETLGRVLRRIIHNAAR